MCVFCCALLYVAYCLALWTLDICFARLFAEKTIKLQQYAYGTSGMVLYSVCFFLTTLHIAYLKITCLDHDTLIYKI